MRSLGVIGGLGPMATAYFLELIVQMTDAKTDQEHLDVIVFNRPDVPDRTAYILGKSKDSPFEPMLRTAHTLETLGASCLAAPCITSHCFYEDFQAAVRVPFLNMVAETVAHLKQNGIQKAGILATTGTIHTQLFQKELEKQGLEWVIPCEIGQQQVMHLIYNNVKAGQPVELDRFELVSSKLREAGAECLILGCTELSLIKRDYPVGPGCLDALEVLAQRSILTCGKPLKPNYQTLITQ